MNGMSDVWKIQYVGWGRVINIAQGEAVCCIYYDTLHECCIFRRSRINGVLTGLLFCMGGLSIVFCDYLPFNTMLSMMYYLKYTVMTQCS